MATENDKVNTGALGTLVVVGLFATLSIALSVTALVRYSVQGVVDQRQTLVQQEYRELRQGQTEKIGASPAWTDKGKGLVSIPIDRAKAKVLSDLARDPASASPPAPAPTAPPSAPPAEGDKVEAAPTATHAAGAGAQAPAPAHSLAAVKPRALAGAAPPPPAPKPTDG
jgi:hypothetical protein